MSRGGGGGRGGGRGGRRGGRGGMANNLPWDNDPNLELDGRPSELFPEYNVPQAAPLSKKEERQISCFLLFREQVHDGPLFTQARTWSLDSTTPGRVYGQDQINKRYGVKNKATVDPFLAMPTYSQRFSRQERSLPDLASRPFAKEFFPPELHATLEGADGATGGAKRRKMTKKTHALSNITSLRTAEEIFLPEAEQQGFGDVDGQSKALQMLDKIDNNDEGADGLDLDDEDDWVRPTNAEDGEDNAEDEDQYDDESGDDYNAEQYFEENQADDDYDEGGDGGDDFF